MDLKTAYIAPQIKTVDIMIQGGLCQDSGTGAVSIDEYKEEYLDW